MSMKKTLTKRLESLYKRWKLRKNRITQAEKEMIELESLMEPMKQHLNAIEALEKEAK